MSATGSGTCRVILKGDLTGAVGAIMLLLISASGPAGIAWADDDPVFDAEDTLALQREPEKDGRYDWGPSVMRDGETCRMWWVRLGGENKRCFEYAADLPDGERFEFTYPDWGDRIYYAESRDGRTWHLDGEDFGGAPESFGPDADGPLMVLGPAETDLQRHHVGNPSVIKVDGTFYLYYEAPCEYVVGRDAESNPVVRQEFHNQVFVATSADGRRFRHHPEHQAPQPIIRAPQENKNADRQRYGLGQPSVFHRQGRFVMHYVDSCTGPGDFIVRIEADNPFFENARPSRRSLQAGTSQAGIPAGAVARFAQTDVKYLGRTYYLIRPAYGTGNLGLLASRTGLFDIDAGARSPADVFPQLRLADPRGDDYRERLFPRFLTTPEGEILVQNGCIVVYYSSGRGFKEHANTWDLHRCEIALERLRKAGRPRLARPH